MVPHTERELEKHPPGALAEVLKQFNTIIWQSYSRFDLVNITYD